MTQPLMVIAAGGTGGHMFPAQALAEAMLAKGWRVKLSTDARGARYTGGFPDAVQVEVVKSATFTRGGILAKLMVAPRIGAGVFSALKAMRKDRPAVVVGFGGYPSIPAMGAAVTMGLPCILHEQNGVLGRVNQLFATRVDAIACGTWPTELPDGVEGLNIGNPVRAAILDRAGAGYIPPGDYPMNLLVFGGSQGASILANVVPAAVAQLPDTLRANLKVSQQAREAEVDTVRAAYDVMGISHSVEIFFTDMPERLAEAQLVVCRSGASSVADIAIVGRPAIFVPLAAAVRDEQTANARALHQAGAAAVLQESEFTPDHLAQVMSKVLGDADTATRMASAALGQGKPDATQALVDLVEQVSGTSI